MTTIEKAVAAAYIAYCGAMTIEWESDPEGQLARLCKTLGLSVPTAPPSRLSAQPRQLEDDLLIREVFATHAHRFQPYCTWQGYACHDIINIV